MADETLKPGDRLPTVRALAQELGVSPATVNAAYRKLRERGLVTGSGRAGLRVSDRRLAPARRLAAVAPPGVRNLADGNPDPALLPPLPPALVRLSGRHWLYGQAGRLPELAEWARQDVAQDGLPAGNLLVVGGSLDGVERALQTRLRPGDTVAVEDPGYGGVLDLLPLLGLGTVPVAVDAEGMRPDSLARALERRPKACILTPRAQNPTGAALSPERARQLADVFARHPDVLLIEDDHAGPVSGAAPVTVAGRDVVRHWVVVRSMTKTLGPDIRLAVLIGDALTVQRIERRQQAGAGWVSHVIQELALTLLTDSATPELFKTARDTYAKRREGLDGALSRHGIGVTGSSGFNMWIPVPAEGAITAALQTEGWAVRPGESFRTDSAPGLRVTISTLDPADAEDFADALAACLRGSGRVSTA